MNNAGRNRSDTHAGTAVVATVTPPPDAMQTAPQLALRPREAAAALGISERLLWSMTNRGEVPHMRIGRAVVYPIEVLREWMREQAEKGTRR